MRPNLTGALIIGAMVSLTACADPRIDPTEAAERAFAGSAIGATLGAGFGSAFFINPLLGGWVGAASGAAVGVGVGIITTPPAVTYGPIPAADTAGAPSFYDTWPQGYSNPPIGAGAPPPPARPG